MSWNPRADAGLYASWGQGFLPPATEELANNPDGMGGFNTHLVPATSQGEEVGVRGGSRGVSYDVALFHLTTNHDFGRYRVAICLVTHSRHYRFLYLAVYVYSVNKTTATTQIAALQTLATEKKGRRRFITLKDGSNVKYLMKAQPMLLEAAKKDVISRQLYRTTWHNQAPALSIGDSPLPVGVALEAANALTAKKR